MLLLMVVGNEEIVGAANLYYVIFVPVFVKIFVVQSGRCVYRVDFISMFFFPRSL